MALVFHYYLGKFGINIFPDLKGKEIKYKKTEFVHFFYYFDQNKVYTYKNTLFKTLIS